MNFSSTLLAQTNDPKEIQKADLDLLTKVNQVAAAIPTLSTGAVTTYVSWASVVAYAAPLPQTAAGVGQKYAITAAANTALVLPAGGTWDWEGLYFAYGVGSCFNPVHFGVASDGTQSAGGTTILPAQGAAYTPVAWIWRIA